MPRSSSKVSMSSKKRKPSLKGASGRSQNKKTRMTKSQPQVRAHQPKVPPRIQRKIHTATEQIVALIRKTVEEDSIAAPKSYAVASASTAPERNDKVLNNDTNDSNSIFVHLSQHSETVLQDRLQLVHVCVHDDWDAQLNALAEAVATEASAKPQDTNDSDCMDDGNDENSSVAAPESASFSAFLAFLWHQQQLAYQVFHALDEAGKGVVVLEDLQRVAGEFLFQDSEDNDDHDDILRDMMAFGGNDHDGSSSGFGEGLLSREDLVQIARRVRLQDA